MELINKRLEDGKQVVWDLTSGDYLEDVTLKRSKALGVFLGQDEFYFAFHFKDKSYVFKVYLTPMNPLSEEEKQNRVLNPPGPDRIFEYGKMLKIGNNIKIPIEDTAELDNIYKNFIVFLAKRFGAPGNPVIVSYTHQNTGEHITVESMTSFEGGDK